MSLLLLFAGFQCTGLSFFLSPIASTLLYLYPIAIVLIPILLITGTHNKLRIKLARPGITLALIAFTPLVVSLFAYYMAYYENGGVYCAKKLVSFLFTGPTWDEEFSMLRLALTIFIIILGIGMLGLLYLFIRGVEPESE